MNTEIIDTINFIINGLDVLALNELIKLRDSINKEIFSRIENNDQICPNCKSNYIIIEGRCQTCLDCGWSKCDI